MSKNKNINWPEIWKVPSNVKKSDTELAKELGTTRQNVSAARKRYNQAPSPSGHGGCRNFAGRSSVKTIRVSGVPVDLVKKIRQDHGRRRMSFEAWMIEAMEKAVTRSNENK